MRPLAPRDGSLRRTENGQAPTRQGATRERNGQYSTEDDTERDARSFECRGLHYGRLRSDAALQVGKPSLRRRKVGGESVVEALGPYQGVAGFLEAPHFR